MALDVKQAQEVQQVILPEARQVLPGLTIESEYRSAREVGGDFFQIIPHKTDGSLLIVAGDVTGKGLKAGMLVALLVGAIRSTSDWSTDPMVILKALNERLVGRSDAQATCLALRIASDGAVTLANAGHIAPYLNGQATRRAFGPTSPPRCNRNGAYLLQPISLPRPKFRQRFFNQVKHCRRVANRYDKLAANYLAFIQLASIRLWLRVYKSTP